MNPIQRAWAYVRETTEKFYFISDFWSLLAEFQPV